MVTVGVLARLEAKPGKEEEVARFLEGALPLASEVDGRAGASRRPGVVRLGGGASPTYLSGAFSIEDRFSLSFWDSLVVSAAQVARCDMLLTEDLQTGGQIDGVMIVDPFSTAVGGI